MKVILFFFIIATSLLGISNQYIIKGDKDFSPYEFLDKENKPQGFSIDLMRAVAKKMNLNISIELGIWREIKADLEAGRADLLMAMFSNQERRKTLNFSTPYFKSSIRIFIRKGSHIKSIKDLKNKTIITLDKDIAEEYIRANHPSIKVITRDHTSKVLKDFSEGVADASIMTHIQAITTLEKNNIKNVQTVGKVLHEQDLCFALNKNNKELLQKVNQGLDILKKTGEYDKIYNKWFSVGYERSTKSFIKLLLFILLPIFFIIALILLWSVSLKKQVRLKISELKENKENLRIMFESIGDGVLVTDLHSHITMMNPIAEKILGWKLEEVIGKELDKVAPNKTMPYKKRIENTLLHGREIITDRITIITRYEKEYDITFTSTPIRQSSGHIYGFIIVFRDITQEMKLQEQVHRYSKLETIGELAGGVAHDFNNMLSGIMGAVQVIDTFESTSTPEQQEYMELIKATILRASSLTEKLLSFGRKTSYSTQALQLETTLKDTFRLLRGSLHKNIQLKLTMHSSNNQIKGNRSALQNLFMNLAINAEQAMPSGGQFHVITKNYSIDMNTSKFTSKLMTKLISKLPFGEYIEIKVSDTGHGISSEHLDKIFDPFFTTKPQTTHSGLGLSSVYGIVQNHGGIITVQSEINKGTTFTILLPAMIQEKKASQKESQRAIQKKVETERQFNQKPASILVVDDEEIIRKTASHILKHLGYSVLSAENGLKAIELIEEKNHDIDLVITDMMMPEMNGRELLIKVQEFNKKLNKDIKVLMSSGFTKGESIQELEDLGLSGFLNKPYIKSEMSELIKNILSDE